MSLPTVELTGNISKIQMKHLPNGKAITSFQLECSEKNKNGEWDNLYLKGECWEKSAEFVNQWFKDGDVAIVTGKLFTNVYKKQDGTNAYEVKFKFPSVSFPPKSKNEQQQPAQQNYNAPQQQQQQAQQNSYEQNIPTIDIDSDIIPF